MPSFDLALFRTSLRTVAVGRNLVHLPSTTSTMDDAREAAAAGCASGTLILAEYQSRGRGRRGRSFYAPDAANLYFTLVLRPSRSAVRSMPLAVPLAVCESLNSLGLDAGIKWPNDIWVSGRKIAGMLIDAESGMAGTTVYPGIGVNVNGDPTVEPALAAIASSVARELRRPVAREPLLAEMCNRLEAAIETPFEELLPRYRQRSLVIGRDVLVTPPSAEPFVASALDIAPDGDLLVRLESGEVRSVIAADVSVRPA